MQALQEDVLIDNANSQVVTTSMVARNQIIGSAQSAKHKSDVARFGSTPRKPIFVNIVFEHQGKFPVSRPIPAKYLQPQTVSRPLDLDFSHSP